MEFFDLRLIRMLMIACNHSLYVFETVFYKICKRSPWESLQWTNLTWALCNFETKEIAACFCLWKFDQTYCYVFGLSQNMFLGGLNESELLCENIWSSINCNVKRLPIKRRAVNEYYTLLSKVQMVSLGELNLSFSIT